MMFTNGAYMFIAGIAIHEAFVNKWPKRGAKTFSEVIGALGIVLMLAAVVGSMFK